MVAGDPTAFAGRVTRDCAAGDGGVALEVAGDPTTVSTGWGRVALDRAVGDVGAAVPAVDPAAVEFSGRIARDRAVGDGGAAVVAAGDPAAVIDGRVARDRAAADGGVAVVAVDPAAVIDSHHFSSRSAGNQHILNFGSIAFTAVDHEHAATLLGIDGGCQGSIFIDGPLDGDGLAAGVEAGLVVGAGGDVDHVAID